MDTPIKPVDAPIKQKYLSVQRAMMSPLVRDYWSALDQANEQGKPVISALGAAPQEIFRAADGVVFFGENFGAGCAVARVSQELCEIAESKGFPMELCSYIRTNVGAMATGRNPMGKTLPKPDLVAYVNGRCSAYAGWGKIIREMNPGIPVLAIDVPPLRDDTTAEEYRQAHSHVAAQIKDMIKFIDGWQGRKFDYDRFAEGIGNTGKGARAFVSLQNTLKAKPVPISLMDIFIQLFPMVCLKGMPQIAEYYNAAKEEVDQRIVDGVTAIPEEKFRIYWDGIAIWTRLTRQFQQLAKHGASLVSAAYAYNMADAFTGYDAEKPIESLADGMLRSFSNVGLQAKIDYVTKLVTDFNANGIIMQVSRSCKPFFHTELSVVKGAVERTGVPYVEVHGDMGDPRLYSEQEIEDRIESFLTRLAAG